MKPSRLFEIRPMAGVPGAYETLVAYSDNSESWAPLATEFVTKATLGDRWPNAPEDVSIAELLEAEGWWPPSPRTEAQELSPIVMFEVIRLLEAGNTEAALETAREWLRAHDEEGGE